VNNAVSVFCRDQQIIAPYLKEAAAILAGDQPLSAISIGTEWLYARRQREAFPLLTTAGILGPEMMYRYLHDDGRFLRPYLRHQTSPVYAVNLCNSKLGTTYKFSGTRSPWALDNDILCKLIARLCTDRGASLNRHFQKAPPPPADEFTRPLSRIQACVRHLQLLTATKLSLRLGKSSVIHN